jgi:hypothetical protein
MLSGDLQPLLEELTGESSFELSIQKLIQNYIDVKLSYWKIIDKQFTEKFNMSFLEYQETGYEEWDGDNWSKKEEFFNWESAIAAINYFSQLRDSWILNSSNQN